MKIYYMNNDVTYTQVGEKYGLSVYTVQKIALADNWQEAKKAYRANVEKEVVKETTKSIVDTAVVVNTKHYSTWEKILGIINDILDNHSQHLQYNDGRWKVGTLERIAKVLEMVQSGQRIAKGMEEAIELKKLAIAQEKLELDKKKANGVVEEMEDDGFMEALKGEAEQVWAEEEGD